MRGTNLDNVYSVPFPANRVGEHGGLKELPSKYCRVKIISFVLTLTPYLSSIPVVTASPRTAKYPTDYLPESVPVRFIGGQSEALARFTIVFDNSQEEDETFLITLSTADNVGTVDPAGREAVVTIQDGGSMVLLFVFSKEFQQFSFTELIYQRLACLYLSECISHDGSRSNYNLKINNYQQMSVHACPVESVNITTEKLERYSNQW